MSWDADDSDWDDDYYDLEEPEETFSIPCPSCQTEVYEECEQCPHCGEYVIRSTSPLSDKPDCYIGLAVFGIVATIFALLFAI